MVRTALIRICTLFLILAFAPAALAAEEPLTKSQLKAAMQQVIRDHPELILDVLRENSVTVLEIAQQGGLERQRKLMLAQWQQDLKTPKKVILDRPVRGAAKAPVTIIAYSDFTCPYCAKAAATVEQVLAARKDKVRFIFKHFPLKSHALARTSSEYVVAAFMQDEAKAWALHDAIFADQDRLAEEGEGFLRTAALAQGLNLQKLSTDMKSRKVKTTIDEDMAEGAALGVTGTPFHLVNDLTIRGAAPLSAFLEAVDLALKAKEGKK